MNEILKKTDFNITLNRDNVFKLMDCYKESPIYEEIVEEYNLLQEKVYMAVEPVAFMGIGVLPNELSDENKVEGSPVLYVLLTVGDRVTKLGEKYFAQGDYLSGMLIDAMADDYLFQMDDEIQETLKEICGDRQFGVSKRLDAPNDIPMLAQKVILENTNAKNELQMDVTSGYMFTTIKTTGYILMLTKDINVFEGQHNCKTCRAVSCKMRKKEKPLIKIIENGKDRILSSEPGESIYETLRNNNIYFNAACGGRGTCGKCKIQILEGDLDITSSDRMKISSEELNAGYRLSCKAYPKESCTIGLAVGNESDFEVLVEYENQREVNIHEKDSSYVIGIDIGTTTIAVQLVGTGSKKMIQSFTTINKQRAYGADVISRMQSSKDGKRIELRECVRKDLMEGIKKAIQAAGIEKTQVIKIAIAGNTTMGHLLMGYSCETLGIHPFTPVNIKTIQLPFKEVLGSDYLQIPVVLLPGISTFVGGDIVAGLLSCGFEEFSKPCLLVDLGTNGEMAIGNRDKIIVTSTAAGPAFEGGNISQGVGSIAGAICNVTIEDGKTGYTTIGDKPPLGICGTGVIEITGELVKSGLVDETGLLDEEYFDTGFEITKGKDGEKIIFTQKDIREIQLAKSAIRAGVETLLINYGITYEDVDKVYIAGGFGYKLNLEKAVRIGLLPKELLSKMKAIGNSSLGGAIKYLLDEKSIEKTQMILDVSKEISLASDKNFNDFYMEYMFFEEEGI